ncbi:TD and POZ domain-containing protein 4-like protein [Aphelenchoides fujianensis]|nr:TD and POZ domain-containing protein 4-like protein [Aphelenchoides fujianensis]
MSSIAHFRDGRTIVWRIPNFDKRLAVVRPEDHWPGDLYEYLHPSHGRVLLHLKLVPKDEDDDCLLYVHVVNAARNFSMAVKCEAWMEKSDGTATARKSGTCVLGSGQARGCIVCTSDDLDAFRHAPTVFIIFRLPFLVKKIGTPLPIPTVHRWDVPDFPKRFDWAVFKEEWAGDEFLVDGLPGVKCGLSFSPKGRKEENKEHAGLFLHVVDLGGRPSVSLQFDLWIEAGAKRTPKTTSNHEYTRPIGWGVPQFITQKELKEFAGNGPITIGCEVRPFGAPVEMSATEIHELKLARSFNDPLTSDVKIFTGNRHFRVLSSVLFAKSPVLKAMLEPKLNGAQKAELTIAGEKTKDVEPFLRSLYTNEMENPPAVASRLLPLAVRYGVTRLQEACTQSIVENLSVENALEHLKAAFSPAYEKLEDFKRRVLVFASSKLHVLVKRPDWDRFARENPDVSIPMLTECVKSMLIGSREN